MIYERGSNYKKVAPTTFLNVDNDCDCKGYKKDKEEAEREAAAKALEKAAAARAANAFAAWLVEALGVSVETAEVIEVIGLLVALA